MHLAFLLALAAQVIWAVCSYLDRHLVEKRLGDSTAGILMLYTAALAAIVSPAIALFHPEAMHVAAETAAITVGSGILTYFGLVIYLHAIKKDEAATVVPLFQITPVLVLALSSFMPTERVTLGQALGSLIIVGGAMSLSMDRSGDRARLKFGLLRLVLAASVLYAFSIVMFKMTAIETDFWTSCLWYYVGLAVSGLFMFVFSRQHRADFIRNLRGRNVATIGITTFNDALNLGAEFLYHFAVTLAPLGVIAATAGLRPVLILSIGFALTRLFPNFISDRLTWPDLRTKAIPIIVICVGAIMVNLS